MGGGRIKNLLMVAAAVMVVVNLGNEVVLGKPLVPCTFVFGDSLLDNGNNNYLISLAKADFLPYGIDFPGGPSGRFSNGKTSVDVLGKIPLSLTTPSPAFTPHLSFQILHFFF